MTKKEIYPSKFDEFSDQMKYFYDYYIKNKNYAPLISLIFLLASCNPIRANEARQMNNAAQVIGRENNTILEWVRMSDFKKSYKGVITWYGLADAVEINPELLLLINGIEPPFSIYSEVARSTKKYMFLPEGWQEKLRQEHFELPGDQRNKKYIGPDEASPPPHLISTRTLERQAPTPTQQELREKGIQELYPVGTIFHTVAHGDNLFRLSQKYGVSIEAIQELNGISNPNIINAGDVLAIPGK